MEECLRRSIVQMDLLNPGEVYRIKVNAGKHSRDEDMELVECYKDHYLFINAKGFRESFLKTDLFSGVWEIRGFNPRERLLTAAGKMQEALEVKREVDTKSEIEEEVERIVRENVAKMVERVIEWLRENPGRPGDVSRILIEQNPSQYYIDKVRNEVFEILKSKGESVKITNTRPKYLILRGQEEEEVEEVEEAEETEAVMGAEPLSIREAYMSVHSTIKSSDRRFLEDKAEELQLQITDARERLELMQTRLTTEIEIYEELLEEIQEHLES